MSQPYTKPFTCRVCGSKSCDLKADYQPIVVSTFGNATLVRCGICLQETMVLQK